MAKLINDTYDFGNLKLVTESADKKQNRPPMYIIEGVYAQSEVQNGNGRVYPYELLKEEIDRFDVEMIKTGRALSELEHPDHPEIDPQKACSRIIEMHEDNKSWVGKSCILASAPEFGIKGTPSGDLVLSLLQYGTKLGFSTRALGELNEDESKVVELKLMTIDLVTSPSIGIMCDSNGNRFVNGILESKSFVCNFHPLEETKFDRFEKRISKMPNTRIRSKKNEFLAGAIHDFMESIKRGTR